MPLAGLTLIGPIKLYRWDQDRTKPYWQPRWLKSRRCGLLPCYFGPCFHFFRYVRWKRFLYLRKKVPISNDFNYLNDDFLNEFLLFLFLFWGKIAILTIFVSFLTYTEQYAVNLDRMPVNEHHNYERPAGRGTIWLFARRIGNMWSCGSGNDVHFYCILIYCQRQTACPYRGSACV